MSPLPDFFQLERFSITPNDVTQMVFHCDPGSIHPDVILMPWWQPGIFHLWVEHIDTITKNIVYETEYQGRPITIIRTGIGAPQAGDSVLALGCTDCKRIIFAGSTGGLLPNIHIGDLLMPEFSYSGDGFSRYLEPGIPLKDCFLECIAPDEQLSLALSQSVAEIAGEESIAVHTGPVFCIDSILSQFRILDYIVRELGCIGIEMETSAVFKAAHAVGIQAAAVFSVSDVPVRNKTLYAGRSQEEQNFRKEIRSKILAKAVLNCLHSFQDKQA